MLHAPGRMGRRGGKGWLLSLQLSLHQTVKSKVSVAEPGGLLLFLVWPWFSFALVQFCSLLPLPPSQFAALTCHFSACILWLSLAAGLLDMD